MSSDDRLDNLILAVANHPSVKGLGKTKLWKLIYFIEVALLREEGLEPSVGFVKQPHGPVPAEGNKRLAALEERGAIAIKKSRAGNYELHEVIPQFKPDAILSRSDLAVINKICIKYGRQEASILSLISHDEPAWIRARMGGALNSTLMAYGPEEDPEGL